VGTFIGFPLAGVTARLVAGDIDTTGAALVGGLAGGAVLGIAQAAIGGLDHSNWVRSTGATALGLATGLAAGAASVGFDTDTASLVVMGAISGAIVGIAQALAIPMRTSDRIAWALATPALWALGWFITSQVIVDADTHHATFGSSGALAVSALAGVLHTVRRAATNAPATTRTMAVAR
jgi:hypothetical protein